MVVKTRVAPVIKTTIPVTRITAMAMTGMITEKIFRAVIMKTTMKKMV
jgi:hypothetical protein